MNRLQLEDIVTYLELTEATKYRYFQVNIMSLAISYIRFSTTRQENGNSYQRQYEQTREYCRKHNLELAAEEFYDLGVSGFHGRNRQEGRLGDLIEKIKNKEIARGSFLIVESLDRLSRDKVTKQLTTFLEILNYGVNIVTLFDGMVHSIDKINDAPMSLMMAFTSMIRANEESETKSRRLQSAWSAKRKKAINRTVVTKIVPMWLTVSDGKIQEISSRSQVIRQIFADTIAGLGKRAIAKKLNSRKEPIWGSAKRNKSGLWNESYISKIIHNRAVLGEYQPHLKRDGKRLLINEPIPDYFPRIVSDEDFYLAKIKASERLQKGGRNAPQAANLISGLGRCAECGSLLRFKNKGSGETYLQCASSDLKSPICNSRAINYRSVEKFIVETIVSAHWTTLLGSPAAKNTNSDRIRAIDAKIDQLKSNIVTFADAMESGGESETLLERILTKEAEIKSLNLEKETVKTKEAKRKAQLEPYKALLYSKLFRHDNVEERRKVQSVISNRVESIYCCKNSKNEIGMAILMGSKNLIIASVNVQDTSKSFIIALEPWQLHPESRRVAIYYEFARDHQEELIPEPKLFKMEKGFSPVSEFLSAKAFENLKDWGVIQTSNDSLTQQNVEQMEKFRVLKDSFSSYFPMFTAEKFDGSPLVGVFGESKNLRPLEEARRVLVDDFFDRRI
jgi:DNA invertase Pin-like site-specific DNA recombinase